MVPVLALTQPPRGRNSPAAQASQAAAARRVSRLAAAGRPSEAVADGAARHLPPSLLLTVVEE